MKKTIILTYAITAFGLLFSSACSAERQSAPVKPDMNVGKELKFCDDCPLFVEVPSPPTNLRNITHVAKFELTWRNYLAAHQDGTCPLPISNPVGPNAYIALKNKLHIDWPINDLDEEDVGCYLRWLGRKSGRIMALPTEAEWEWFAAAGSTAIYPWGDAAEENKAAIKGGNIPVDLMRPKANIAVWPYLQGARVGSFPPNDWGLYDIIGNLAELTSTSVSGEERLKMQPTSVFALQARDRTSVVLKGSDWKSGSLPREGIKHRSYSVVWDGRYLSKPGVRIVILVE